MVKKYNSRRGTPVLKAIELGQTKPDNIEKALEGLIGRVASQSTTLLRQTINRYKKVAVQHSNNFKSLKNNLALIYGRSSAKSRSTYKSAIEGIQEKALVSILNDVFFVLKADSKETLSLNTIISKDRKLIQQLQFLNGRKIDDARKQIMSKSNKSGFLSNKLKLLLDEDETYTSENYREIIVDPEDYDKPLSWFEQDAEKRIKQLLDTFKMSLTEDESGTFLGAPIAAFNQQTREKIASESIGGAPFNPSELIQVYSKDLDATFYFIYNMQAGFNTKYVVVKAAISQLYEGENISKSTITKEARPVTTRDTLEQYEIKLKAASEPRDPSGLLAKTIDDIANTINAGSVLLEWEHNVSLVTENLLIAIKILTDMEESGLVSPQIDKAKAMLPVMKRLFFFSMKTDSIFGSLTDSHGNIVQGAKPFTKQIIAEILAKTKIDYTKFNYFYVDSGGKPQQVTRGGEPDRTITVDFEEGIPTYTELLGEAGIIGRWGLPDINGAKGHISKEISDLLRALTRENMIETLKKVDTFIALSESHSSNSFVVSAALRALNLPDNNPAKRRSKRVQIKDINLSTGSSSASSKKTLIKGPGKVAKSKAERSEIINKTIRVNKPTRTLGPVGGLLGLLNSNISDEVKRLMTGGRLKNRTGRFANSVVITKANSRNIYVDYMHNPFNYDIFRKGSEGTSPWNSGNRDPVDLISLAVRNILTKNSIKFAKSVNIGK